MIDNKLFFITGRGRSGTWMINSILNAHSEICVAPESLFIVHLATKYGKKKSWSEKDKRQFLTDLMEEKRMEIWWKIDTERLKEKLLNTPQSISFSDMCKEVYHFYAESENKGSVKLLGDKNPSYTLYLDQLAKIYPESKFIHVIRDPRDNVISFQNVDFDLQDQRALAARWNHYNKLAYNFHRKNKDRMMLLKFEDVLTKPSETLAGVCRFLGLEYQASILDFYKDAKNVLEWNKKIKTPIDASKAFAWKNKLQTEEVNKINAYSHEMAEILGYETSKCKGSITDLPSLIKAKMTDIIEANYFKLPFPMRMPILNKYRVSSNTMVETD